MPETFGDRLRKQRELSGVGLTAIAEDTKISFGLLDALEHDDLSHWPTGIFRRSFIRSYARAVGLDPEATVREFLEAHPDAAAHAAPAGDERMLAADRPEREESNGGAVRSRLGLILHGLTASRKATDQPHFGRLATAESLSRAAPAPAVHAAEPVREPESPPTVSVSRIDLTMLAKLCTNLAAAQGVDDTVAVLESLAQMLDIVGLVIWRAHLDVARLVPVAACGYPPSLLARIPEVSSDADNATAAAYRSVATCLVAGNDREHGALVVPIVGTSGCVGVLAVEMRGGAERDQQVQAVAAIVAAQLSGALAHVRLALDGRKFAS